MVRRAKREFEKGIAAQAKINPKKIGLTRGEI